MDRHAIEERHRAGLAAAREAGRFAAGYYGRRASLPVEHKGLQDFVTEADRATEEMIVATLGRSFRTPSFLGEEGGRRKEGSLLWVIDPIDGTANFVRGVDHWCDSIGLMVDGVPVLGFIYDPIADEMYSAAAGGGAFMNGAPIRVSGASRVADALIEIGFSFRRPVAQHVKDAELVLDAGCEYRRFGSGALGLAYTAIGRIDGYFERHINLWDVAAGLVIVSEAGGRMNDFLAGNAIAEGSEILATTPALFEPLQRLFDHP